MANTGVIEPIEGERSAGTFVIVIREKLAHERVMIASEGLQSGGVFQLTSARNEPEPILNGRARQAFVLGISSGVKLRELAEGFMVANSHEYLRSVARIVAYILLHSFITMEFDGAPSTR